MSGPDPKAMTAAERAAEIAALDGRRAVLKSADKTKQSKDMTPAELNDFRKANKLYR